ncbi:carbamoyltransferase HypF [Halomonas sp. DP8Y7-1]|uniref:carbamoyltransferase HypF n=1 Tax=Halomonas sp. DP8Y7-1 TaxID=2859078 RepID=UPI001C957B2D|nr:carbamoyltransferase HypF [Halomonas sp. DP8Y7-1]MBY6030976.1 carbamoyltransferase HypF [Halomonas sp. DP8Y7-1]
MTTTPLPASPDLMMSALEIRVQGCVQGVGFRPWVWQLATAIGVTGNVRNDGQGVVIRAQGSPAQLVTLLTQLDSEPPPLATITGIASSELTPVESITDFTIIDSRPGLTRTDIAADAAVCAACKAEILDPMQRRSGYALTNCTHCGPRLSIIRAMPYDRAATTMAAFPLCASCRQEYCSPADRRFHAQPIACPDCGPRVSLVRLDRDHGVPASGSENHADISYGSPESSPDADPIMAAAELICAGHIVAIKGLGGYQLACDASREDVVARLRQLKRRPTRPLALIMADLAMVSRYCHVSPREAEALESPAAPIVLLERRTPMSPKRPSQAPNLALDIAPNLVLDIAPNPAPDIAPNPAPDIAPNPAPDIAPNLAPGLDRLGVMLPSTPLHLLLFRHIDVPLVLTSGNASGEPQLIDDARLSDALGAMASHALSHDRGIARRVDDSLVQDAAGALRVLRRARGFAPTSLPLPPGFEDIGPGLALGPQQKATFCLIDRERAILSPHQGDLDDPATLDDFEHHLQDFLKLYDHRPDWLACDRHPDYHTSHLATAMAAREGLTITQVGHHHAHIAACLGEHGRPLSAPPVLGIALDGLGLGLNGELWGGECLLADYQQCQRVAALKAVPMPGGAAAAREPWRNLVAQWFAGPGIDALLGGYPQLEVVKRLGGMPLQALVAMLKAGLNSPKASSCGRLFDAVAAALELSFEHQHHEGEAAMALETLAARTLARMSVHDLSTAPGYPLDITVSDTGVMLLDPAPLWPALFDDLARGCDPALCAARFHLGLATALARVTSTLSQDHPFDTVALSGGCFHNRSLLALVEQRLGAQGFKVLSHRQVPANDGGIALGQALIAAAPARRLPPPHSPLHPCLVPDGHDDDAQESTHVPGNPGADHRDR